MKRSIPLLYLCSVKLQQKLLRTRLAFSLFPVSVLQPYVVLSNFQHESQYGYFWKCQTRFLNSFKIIFSKAIPFSFSLFCSLWKACSSVWIQRSLKSGNPCFSRLACSYREIKMEMITSLQPFTYIFFSTSSTGNKWDDENGNLTPRFLNFLLFYLSLM